MTAFFARSEIVSSAGSPRRRRVKNGASSRLRCQGTEDVDEASASFGEFQEKTCVIESRRAEQGRDLGEARFKGDLVCKQLQLSVPEQLLVADRGQTSSSSSSRSG